ncbi:MAG: ABC transporter permease, partial [Acidobacteriota bacterium]
PNILPALFSPRFDASVITYSLGVSLLAGLAFGIGPALQAVRGHLRSALVERARGGTAGRERKRLLAGFVVAEFALALAILVGAAVLTDLFDARLSFDPGFTAEGVLSAELPLSAHRFADDAALTRFVEALETDMAALPGVTMASTTTRLPRAREGGQIDIEIDGLPTERGDERTALALTVGVDYFRTLEIDVLRGRDFTRADNAEAAPVAMVDERFAERYFDGESPLGRRVVVAEATYEIVGLVPPVAQERMSGLTPAQPTLYLPFAQAPQPRVRALLRTDGDPYALRDALQAAVWGLAPDQPVAEVTSLVDHVETELAGPATISKILYFVGLLALVLASLGIYGVMAFRVGQQRAEIGVRMALGAGPMRVQGLVTRQGAVLAGLGLILGIPLASGIVWMVHGMLGAAPSDGITPDAVVGLEPMLRVTAILVGAGLLACWLPALRAVRIDPAEVLQES